MATNIFFSVGEPSGDQHAARLIRQLQCDSPDLRSRGFGGREMQAAGCRLDRDLTKHAVVGLVEVLPKLRQFFRFVDQAEEVFRSGQVDAVVMVDFPGFNWHIAKRAKQYSIPVFYYCPPQLWAWGGWRVKKMRRTVDHVLSVLPVEQEFFTRHDVPSTYVGHPFFDAVASQELDKKCLDRLDRFRDEGQELVAVLPGSRTHEVHGNWPIMLEAIRGIHRTQPHARFLVAAYRDSQCMWCRDQMSEEDRALPIDFFVGATSEVIEASRCAMMVSGSVSLELMARRTPAAVIYRLGRVMNVFVKCMVGVDSMTLPNLMSRRKVFPEMVSTGNPKPAVDFLTETIGAMLGDQYYYAKTMGELDQLCREHGSGGATRRASRWLCERLGVASHRGQDRRGRAA